MELEKFHQSRFRRGTEDLLQAINSQGPLILEQRWVETAMFFRDGVERLPIKCQPLLTRNKCDLTFCLLLEAQ